MTDPRIDKLAAHVIGKEAALLTPSGTMSNLIAVLAQTRSGDEIILGSEAHMLWYEVGGAAAIGSIVMRTVPNNPDGTMELDAVRNAIRARGLLLVGSGSKWRTRK